MMTTLAERIFKQINYQPMMRGPRKGGNNSKASEAQLRLIADLLARGMEQGKLRWDLTETRSYTIWQASQLIDSLKKDGIV